MDGGSEGWRRARQRIGAALLRGLGGVAETAAVFLGDRSNSYLAFGELSHPSLFERGAGKPTPGDGLKRAAELALEIATKKLTDTVSDSDRERLMDEFITRVEPSGAAEGAN